MLTNQVSALKGGLVRAGDLASFMVSVVVSVPVVLKNYRKEVLRQIMDIAWGSGAILVGGGTIGIMILLGLSSGTSLGIEGFNGLELIGLAPITGFVSASVNTRELAPLVAALALGGQVGCRFTAQIGSMKLHEEIDALEVMAVNPIHYLITTRVIGAMVAIIPLYFVGLLGSWLASKFAVVYLFGQSGGQYDHYFYSFLQPTDVIKSVIKMLVFALLVALIHAWFGFNASGGPAGVGEATGRAIRASIVTIVIADMLLTLAFWGGDPGFRIQG
ncbi:ABC transporter permease [Nocardioides jiangxiensis]|uniref:ABC transporter permease n=1 Tax=Nocardioides jiangxiensis TaxID=3064524 RepID=A0ABT9B535_9ACTN|nr:ABC transporter permease [Nocardioides sp. WY-20]MDO7869505.1 ABC transporter permease [Nocardioides sp. WY-20]